MGGIPTNNETEVYFNSEETVQGLYAAGEVACVSVHGANRLGTNSLLDINVFGKRAGRKAAEYAASAEFLPVPDDAADRVLGLLDTLRENKGTEKVGAIRADLQKAMEADMQVFRTDETIRAALATIAELEERYKNISIQDKGKRFNLDLLEAAGVRTPQHQLTQAGNRSILILRRFDRTRDGARIGYISAMTATGSSDGDQKDYADLAEAICDLSRSPVQDLHEFYDRIIASIALGNTDDHLRNHGFLADRGLWRLSPVFDVNPNPDPSRPRATSIMGADAMPDEIDGLLAIANDYRLTQSEARERIRRITASLSGWRGQARANRVPEREITMMSESIEPRLEALTRAAHAKD